MKYTEDRELTFFIELNIKINKMKLKKIIILIMIFSNLLSYAQKSKHEIIQKDVKYYEFNNERDKIYILNSDYKLSVYNTGNGVLTDITTFSDKEIKEEWGKKPLYFTEDGNLFITGSKFVYKIHDNKVLEKIPISIIETISSWDIRNGTSDEKTKEFNNFLSKPDIKVIILDNNYCIVYSNGEATAFTTNRLNNYGEDNNKQKIESLKKNISCIKDESHLKKNIGNKETVNYFLNDKIIIEEKNYSCEIFRSVMAMTRPECKNKMKVITNEKVVKFKDKKRRSRFVVRGWGKGEWNCDMHERIPNSNYISDKDGNIYLMIYAGESDYVFNLIKINH